MKHQAGFQLDGLLKVEDIDAATLYGNTSYEFTLSTNKIWNNDSFCNRRKIRIFSRGSKGYVIGE